MTPLDSVSVSAVLAWCVEHSGECLGDHPAILERAKSALAANALSSERAPNLAAAAGDHVNIFEPMNRKEPREFVPPLVKETTDKLQSTPRTDAFFEEVGTMGPITHNVRWQDFARQLERELADEKRLNAGLIEGISAHKAELAKLQQSATT